LSLLPPFDTAFDGFDTATNGGLDELRVKLRFVSEVVVERVSSLSLVGLALRVRRVRPTVFGGSVECVALLVGNIEFHDGSPTHVHTSERYRRYLYVWGSVGRSVAVASHHVGFLSGLLVRFAHSLLTGRRPVRMVRGTSVPPDLRPEAPP